MMQGQWLLYVLLLVFELQSTKVQQKGFSNNTGYIMMTSLLVSSSDLVIGATFVLIAWNSHLDLLNTLNTHFSNHFFGWILSHLGHFSNRNHFLRRSVSKPPWVTDVFLSLSRPFGSWVFWTTSYGSSWMPVPAVSTRRWWGWWWLWLMEYVNQPYPNATMTYQKWWGSF